MSEYCNNRIVRLTATQESMAVRIATLTAERDAAVAAGRKLAERVVRHYKCTFGGRCAECRSKDFVDNESNPLALAWVKAAQEASDGQ